MHLSVTCRDPVRHCTHAYPLQLWSHRCSSCCHVLLQAGVTELAKHRRAGTASSSHLWEVAHQALTLGHGMMETACLSREGGDELKELCSSVLQALQGGQASADGLAVKHGQDRWYHCTLICEYGCAESQRRLLQVECDVGSMPCASCLLYRLPPALMWD